MRDSSYGLAYWIFATPVNMLFTHHSSSVLNFIGLPRVTAHWRPSSAYGLQGILRWDLGITVRLHLTTEIRPGSGLWRILNAIYAAETHAITFAYREVRMHTVDYARHVRNCVISTAMSQRQVLGRLSDKQFERLMFGRRVLACIYTVALTCSAAMRWAIENKYSILTSSFTTRLKCNIKRRFIDIAGAVYMLWPWVFLLVTSLSKRL